MRIAAKTDQGKLRNKNEDSYKIITGKDKGEPIICVIADGMGGHNSGEIASKLAVQRVEELSYTLQDCAESNLDFFECIRNIMMDANQYIFMHSKQKSEYEGMGTTLILAVIYKDTLYIGHVGDSRAYRVSGDSIERITNDHSFIEEMIKSGSITREEAENHPQRNVITRAVGCSDSIEIDTYEINLKKGDVLLFCTDGVSNIVSEEELLELLRQKEHPEKICSRLIGLCNERGGPDNITAIVLQNN